MADYTQPKHYMRYFAVKKIILVTFSEFQFQQNHLLQKSFPVLKQQSTWQVREPKSFSTGLEPYFNRKTSRPDTSLRQCAKLMSNIN